MLTLAFMDFAFNWWEGLDLPRQIFYGIGLLAGMLALLLAVLAFAGIEGHDVFDSVDDVGHEGGGGIFSVKPLTGFFLGFGWIGGIALDAGWSLGAATLAAFFVGGVLMTILVWMIRFILSLRTDGTMRIEEALGAVGTVYITLPPKRGDSGQIVLTLNGRSETLPAFSTSDQPLHSGAKVKVIEVIDGRSVLVEPLGGSAG